LGSLSRLLLEHHQAFHPIWGQLLKTGYQNSRYGHQIDRFACLYTSHVSVPVFVCACVCAFVSGCREVGGKQLVCELEGCVAAHLGSLSRLLLEHH
jgi:hypothetical protein